jgi:hypothetical protein
MPAKTEANVGGFAGTSRIEEQILASVDAWQMCGVHGAICLTFIVFGTVDKARHRLVLINAGATRRDANENMVIGLSFWK